MCLSGVTYLPVSMSYQYNNPTKHASLVQRAHQQYLMILFYHNIKTVTKSNRKIVKRVKIDTVNTQIHDLTFLAH